MNVDWSSLLVVGVASVVGAALTVALFATGIKLLAAPPAGAAAATAARDDETDEISGPSRPPAATVGAVVCFALAGLAVLFGVYLIVPAFRGG